MCDYNNDDHNDAITNKHAQVVDSKDHQHHNDSDDGNDCDDVSSSKASDGLNANVDSYYLENDHEVRSMTHIDDDGNPQPNSVGYVRTKRRSIDSLLKDCNKRNLPRKGSKCITSLSHLTKQISLAVIQSDKQMACGSDILVEVEAPSPVSTIVGNKRRHALRGIERAHMEESQHGHKKNHIQDWESMRRRTIESSSSNENSCEENLMNDNYHDSVDWDTVRHAGVEELAQTIKERGMHHVLSGRIKAFLKTLHEEQGSLDLEWLRKVSPENAKAYLMGIRGLGVKSVECIRLLTLHHVAFSVDVNVGRICVRLGWVPIEPLPEELQLHLLEFAKLPLTGPMDELPKRLCSSIPLPALTNTPMGIERDIVVENVKEQFARDPEVFRECCNTMSSTSNCCHPYFVEEPASPEPDTEAEIGDIEDFSYFYGSLNDFTEDLLKVSELPDESMNGKSSYIQTESIQKRDKSNSVGARIEALHPTAKGPHPNTKADRFSAGCTLSASCSNYNSIDPSHEKSLYESNVEEIASDGIADITEDASNALISLPEGTHIPAPKLKNIDRLRTVHYVYELPDDHPLVEDAGIREKDDPSYYLLAIWTAGEAPDSLQGIDEDCQEDMCRFSSAKADETVPGTLLIPCRTAMRGTFPLNGTYFQVNEVFADHASSLHPLQVPCSHIWNL